MASDTPDPAREVLRDIPPELAIDCALRWREQRDAAITQRDQAASERDALRAEVEKLRAAPALPAHVRECVEACIGINVAMTEEECGCPEVGAAWDAGRAARAKGGA